MPAFNAVGMGAIAMGGLVTVAASGNAPGALLAGVSSIIGGAAAVGVSAPGVALNASCAASWGAATVSMIALGANMAGGGYLVAGVASTSVVAPGAHLESQASMAPGSAGSVKLPLLVNPRMVYVPGQKTNFCPMRVMEVEVLTIDFAPALAQGETILSASWSNTVLNGEDTSPLAMIQDRCTISGAKVSELFAAHVANATYAPTCTVQTSGGQTIILPEYGFGLLYVPG